MVLYMKEDGVVVLRQTRVYIGGKIDNRSTFCWPTLLHTNNGSGLDSLASWYVCLRVWNRVRLLVVRETEVYIGKMIANWSSC